MQTKSDNLVLQTAVDSNGQDYHVPEIFTLKLAENVVKYLRRISSAVQAFSTISSEFSHVEYPLEKGHASWLYMPEGFVPPFTLLLSRPEEALTGVKANIAETLVEVRPTGLVFKSPSYSGVEYFTVPVQIEDIDPQPAPPIGAQERYANSDGADCPACGSNSVTCAGSWEGDGSNGTQPMRCEECSATWNEITILEVVGFENLETRHA